MELWPGQTLRTTVGKILTLDGDLVKKLESFQKKVDAILNVR